MVIPQATASAVIPSPGPPLMIFLKLTQLVQLMLTQHMTARMTHPILLHIWMMATKTPFHPKPPGEQTNILSQVGGKGGWQASMPAVMFSNLSPLSLW